MGVSLHVKEGPRPASRFVLKVLDLLVKEPVVSSETRKEDNPRFALISTLAHPIGNIAVPCCKCPFLHAAYCVFLAFSSWYVIDLFKEGRRQSKVNQESSPPDSPLTHMLQIPHALPLPLSS